ncbi:MAG: DUF1684 domain-containing protein [Rhodanobacteraceae bacterium]|nr:DUF1684 domain-containing protein [Rhodanobacteraceae bacterium]
MSKHFLALGAAALMSLAAVEAPAMSEHEQEVAAWRTGRIERLTAPDGWLSLVGLHWVPAGAAQTVGNGEGNQVDLGIGPEHLGRIEWADGKPWFLVADGVGATVAGEPATRVELLPELANAPVVVRFGSASLQMLQRGEKFALRIKDSEASTRLKFSGIPHFDVDPSWRIEARFERYPEPRTIEVATVVGTLEAYPNPGRIVFERDGKTHRIEALVEEGTEQYFLIIADRSSGKETYGMARYLYAGPPEGDRIVVDFNKAYNPPCAFTAYATCPMPPEGNRLDLYVSAGEKKYAGAH